MVNILGIRVSRLGSRRSKQLLNQWLEEKSPRLVVTPNPEIILAAQKDEELFHILNQADLAPADGFGLKIASWTKGKPVNRFPGADLTRFLLREACSRGLKILVVFWKGGLSQASDIKKALERLYPELDHRELGIERENIFQPAELAFAQDYAPDLMFVTLGSPWQEKLSFHEYRRLPGLRLAVGVGGSFDFLTGQTKRAPRVMRQLGLEWLWRLALQPRRLRRIWNATAVFAYRDFIDTFINPFRYRPNVVVIIYKIVKGKPYLLIVERSDEAGHWQFPQGGTDGEKLDQAAKREMQEELGVEIEVKQTFAGEYRYIRQNKTQRKRGYKGQSQGLAIARLQSPEEKIKINYWDHSSWAWVLAEEALGRIHPIRQASAKIFLERFNQYYQQTYGQ